MKAMGDENNILSNISNPVPRAIESYDRFEYSLLPSVPIHFRQFNHLQGKKSHQVYNLNPTPAPSIQTLIGS
jgi:hypothetical protein